MIFSGYIEGYYGQLLSWEDRSRILSNLEHNNLKSYLYCPKEDRFHRTFWRDSYPDSWLNAFSSFAREANTKGIEIIFGISPGINFSLENDLQILFQNISSIKKSDIENFAILFDDLFIESSGALHAQIVNECIEHFPEINFFAVPQEYSSSQASPDIFSSKYLSEFNELLNIKVPIFWTGSYVVSKYSSEEEVETWKNLFKRPLIFWDNYFANDYCGPKVILDSYQSLSFDSSKILDGVMINPTGLIETDLICLDFLGQFLNNQDISPKKYFLNMDFPKEFINLMHLFKFEPRIKNPKKDLSNIETLLWAWHHPLKLELYSYLHMLRFILNEQDEISVSALKKRFRI